MVIKSVRYIIVGIADYFKFVFIIGTNVPNTYKKIRKKLNLSIFTTTKSEMCKRNDYCELFIQFDS